MRKFRRGENQQSFNFFANLNELVRVCNKVEHMKVVGAALKNKSNTLSVNYSNSNFAVGGEAGEAGSGVILWGVITESLSYASSSDEGVALYTVDVTDNDNPSVITEEQPTIINENAAEVPSSADYRNFIPWLMLDEEIPLLKLDNVYYFLQTFTHVGSEEVKSLCWNETDKRATAVFK